jgi:hypothetical protein
VGNALSVASSYILLHRPEYLLEPMGLFGEPMVLAFKIGNSGMEAWTSRRPLNHKLEIESIVHVGHQSIRE